MTEPTDVELWGRVRAGDPESFGEMFSRHGPTIHRYAARRTGDLTQADDITATVFLEAWRIRERTELLHPSALPWLYGVATNVINNWRRSRRRHDAALRRIGDLPRPSPRLVDERVAAVLEARRVLDRVTHLSRRELDVVVLATWEGLSTAEIAAALDIPLGTVKSRLNRARTRLASDSEPTLAPRFATTPKDLT